MTLHLDLDGGGGQDLVAREHLVAHQLRPRLGGVLDDREQVLVVDELGPVGELLDLARDVLDLLRLRAPRPSCLSRDSTACLPECLPRTSIDCEQRPRWPGS